MKAQHWVLVLLLAAIALQSLYYYPQLPDTVASHFGGAGQPNGWSYKAVFFWTYLGMVFLMVLVFYGLPVVCRKFPSASLNVPHKEYYLAPERRAETLAAFTPRLHWMGNATVGFQLGVFQLAIEANLPGQRGLPLTSFLVLLGAFLAFVGIWVFRIYRLFPKPR
ncbi:MAG TPA: DUF1648 domain-containing protein [Terriglobia bacterium]